MSIKELRAFTVKVATDQALQEQLITINQYEPPNVVAIAKYNDFEITKDYLEKYPTAMDEEDDIELSEGELSLVAGGSSGWWCFWC